MQTTPYRRRAVFMAQWLTGLAMAALVIPAAPSLVFGGEQASPDPTGKAQSAALPVDISIDIATGEEDALPKPEITIHLLNAKSGTEVELTLPQSNVASDHSSSAAAHAPFDTPPVTAPSFDTPPVTPGSVVEAPLFDAPPAVTPSLDVPVADLPPIDPPTVDVPPVATPPVDVPAAGRP